MEGKMISKEKIEFYKENGYVIFNNILDHDICDQYLTQIKKHANEDFGAIMNPDRFDFLVAQSFEHVSKSGTAIFIFPPETSLEFHNFSVGIN